jgi:hypothetical protein
MSTRSYAVSQSEDAKIVAAIGKDLGTTSSLTLNGTAYTPAALSALVQNHFNQINVVLAAQAAWKKELASLHTLSTQLTPVVRALRTWLVNTFGPSSPVLEDFGFAPRPKRVPTADVKAAAVVKRKATRAARGTKGKRQKAAIHGAPAPVTPPTHA